MTNTLDQRQFGFERLEVWHLSLDALALADGIAARIGRPYGELADQLRRASLSVVANLAEGVGKDGKDQLRYLRIARGSAYETAAIIEAAMRLRLCSADERSAVRSRLLSVAAMLTRLLQRDPRMQKA